MMRKKSALDFYYDLPPATTMSRRSDGLILIKCANQPKVFRINEDYVVNRKTGSFHFIGEFLPPELSAKQFLQEWDLTLPSAEQQQQAQGEFERQAFFNQGD